MEETSPLVAEDRLWEFQWRGTRIIEGSSGQWRWPGEQESPVSFSPSDTSFIVLSHRRAARAPLFASPLLNMIYLRATNLGSINES